MMETTEIVREITYNVMGDTRDGAIQAMDEIGMHLVNYFGGAPWVETEDAVQKIHANSTVADHEGFSYFGTRSYKFAGPFKRELGIIENEGTRLQDRDGNV